MIKAQHNQLLSMFPDFKDGDWALKDDGEGPYILKWNRGEPPPLQDAIDAITQGQQDQARKNKNVEDKSAKLDDVIKALINIVAAHLRVTPESLHQELKVELKR